MRESQTAVLERGVVLEGEIATEPFEAAWATEARWFVGEMRGVITTSVRDFGHWLRLVITPEEVTSAPLTRVYLVLKE